MCALAVLAECTAQAGSNPSEESWFLLRAALQLMLASKPNARALRADPAAATEIGLDRAARLLQGYREISGQELPHTPQIHFLLVMFKVG